MKKVWMLLAVALGCIACEKEDKFTMPENELVGTYWSMARYVFSGGPHGDVDSDKDLIDGGGSTIWNFSDNNQMIIYSLPFYPTVDIYREATYQFDLAQRKLTIGKSQYDLLQFTPEQIVYSYVESDGTKRTYYYRPFTNSDALFRNPEEDMFTFSEDKLADTYWSADRETYTGYRYGRYFGCDRDLEVSPPYLGVCYFSEEGTVTVYYAESYRPDGIADVNGAYYKTMGYTYDKERHLLEFGGCTYQLLRLSPKQMVWSYEEESKQRTLVNNLSPFTPTDVWFEKVSQFEDRTGEE